MKKIWLFCLLLFILIIPSNVFAINEVNVFFFHSDTCDVCSQEKAYLDALKQRYPNMRVYSYEISNPDNNNLMLRAKNMYNISKNGVPFTVIGDSAYLGFSQTNKALFQRKVYEYSKNSYQNKFGKELGINYRNDLEGEVEIYKNNDQYQIEESSGNVRTPAKPKTSGYDKYKVTIILVGVGIVLAIIAFIIRINEKRGRI